MVGGRAVGAGVCLVIHPRHLQAVGGGGGGGQAVGDGVEAGVGVLEQVLLRVRVCVAVTRPLRGRYAAVTRPLRDRYAAVARPLRNYCATVACRCATVTQPLHSRYTAVTYNSSP